MNGKEPEIGLIAEKLSTALFPFYLFVLYGFFVLALFLLEKGRKGSILR